MRIDESKLDYVNTETWNMSIKLDEWTRNIFLKEELA